MKTTATTKKVTFNTDYFEYNVLTSNNLKVQEGIKNTLGVYYPNATDIQRDGSYVIASELSSDGLQKVVHTFQLMNLSGVIALHEPTKHRFLGVCDYEEGLAETVTATIAPIAEPEPKAEEPTQEPEPIEVPEPKAEEPTQEPEPIAEPEPKAEEPTTTTNPLDMINSIVLGNKKRQEEQPKAEQPKAEEPKAEQPKVEQPKTEEQLTIVVDEHYTSKTGESKSVKVEGNGLKKIGKVLTEWYPSAASNKKVFISYFFSKARWERMGGFEKFAADCQKKGVNVTRK